MHRTVSRKNEVAKPKAGVNGGVLFHSVGIGEGEDRCLRKKAIILGQPCSRDLKMTEEGPTIEMVRLGKRKTQKGKT